MTVISGEALNRFIPHSGRMCLLRAVISWDTETIRCRADSHRDPQNPLRTGQKLPLICGLEYAAQAMAVHIGLAASDHVNVPSIGFVGAIRDVKLKGPDLDTVAGELDIHAALVFEATDRFMYTFILMSDDHELLTGRASIFLKRHL